LLELDKPKEALTTCQEVLRIVPGYGRAHAVLGRVHEATSDTTQARRAYARALELNPSDRAARARLQALGGTP
jgi:cytochrome c-type biogenesis protein CcmH/NrfG